MPTTDSQTGNEPTTIDIRPGDIIAIPYGVRRDIDRDDPDVRLLSRGVAAVDLSTRSMLP